MIIFLGVAFVWSVIEATRNTIRDRRIRKAGEQNESSRYIPGSRDL